MDGFGAMGVHSKETVSDSLGSQGATEVQVMFESCSFKKVAFMKTSTEREKNRPPRP